MISNNAAEHVLSALERTWLLVGHPHTFALIASQTRLRADFVVLRTFNGDVDIALAASEGTLGLLQLFDIGTNDRKELEVLLCVVLRSCLSCSITCKLQCLSTVALA